MSDADQDKLSYEIDAFIQQHTSSKEAYSMLTKQERVANQN